jgi:hypothetical protein
MKTPEELGNFLHDISNDITVAEGFVKICLSKKRTEEQKTEYLTKSLEKLKSLSETIRNFKHD